MSAKKRQSTQASTKPPSKTAVSKSTTKQAAVLKLLSRPTGTTLAKIVDATGWQPHSARGFLAGVVRKKLKLPLISEAVGDTRVYRIAQKTTAKA